jgi:regulation of enolase protein 1 (concanavalin A-like superfamily)
VEDLIKNGWRWFNEPSSWGGGTVTTDPGTDFWRTTHYGFVRDTGHVLGVDQAGDFELTVTFSGDYRDQYDQAGIAIRLDEKNWIKSGIELVDGQQQISAVVTRDVSDWSVVALAAPADSVTVKADRTGDTVTISHGLNGAPPATMLRLAYFPPKMSVLAGVMCASPTGKGFTTRFDTIDITAKS